MQKISQIQVNSRNIYNIQSKTIPLMKTIFNGKNILKFMQQNQIKIVPCVRSVLITYLATYINFTKKNFFTFFQLCEALNEDISQTKMYPRMEKWWKKGSKCKRQGSFPWSNLGLLTSFCLIVVSLQFRKSFSTYLLLKIFFQIKSPLYLQNL